ncbi:hypothetical protein K1719_014597 [Acacia pycnantha]|nr:hypothetical protein K1719_014597 [Acacia pycnantha]
MKSAEKELPPISYRESLLKNVNSKACWWEWARNDEDDELEDFGAGTDFAKVLNPSDGIRVDLSNPLCPRFEFEDKERERLMKPFRRTLIVKLMGRQLSYGFMERKLKMLWARKGEIDVFDLENEFYLVNFQQHEDYMEALIGGPWVVADAYLNVARWRPDFDPKKATIDSVVAWVRFPDLPAPLFDKKFLLNVGNSIGKAIRLDIHTAQRARGKFARMCVELDLTKSLIPEFNVEGQIISVVYESLGELCHHCGRVEHSKGKCGIVQQRDKEGDMEVEEKEERVVAENVKEDEGGRWKIVHRVRRMRNVGSVSKEQQSGSRFNVLQNFVEPGEPHKEEGRVQQSVFRKSGEERPHSRDIDRKQRVLEEDVCKGERSGREDPPGSVRGGRKMHEERILSASKGSIDLNRKAKVPGIRGKSEIKSGAPDCVGARAAAQCPQKKQGVRVVGKENINPGAFATSSKNPKAMSMKGASSGEEDDDPIESEGISMEEECFTPNLAD